MCGTTLNTNKYTQLKVEVLHESMANFEEGYKMRAEEAHNSSSGAFMRCDDNRCDMALVMGTATFFIGWIIGVLMNKALDHFMEFKTDEAQARDRRDF